MASEMLISFPCSAITTLIADVLRASRAFLRARVRMRRIFHLARLIVPFAVGTADCSMRRLSAATVRRYIDSLLARVT
jgi:hypothetical protein